MGEKFTGLDLQVRNTHGDVILANCLFMETTMEVTQGLADRNHEEYHVFDRDGHCIEVVKPTETRAF